MNDLILASISGVLACIACGFLLTRYWRKRQDEKLVRERLSVILRDTQGENVGLLLEQSNNEWMDAGEQQLPFVPQISRLLDRSGLNLSMQQFTNLVLLLFVSPLLISFAFEPKYLVFAGILSALLAGIPLLVIYIKAEQRRNKFIEQLPDGIELMISVLRGGLSIPNAVKSVGDELPSPCGPEFAEILQRMNLGQSLPDSIQAAVDRYDLFELDLIRRATAIQLEVGGSLADLLEKTNSTLRQRLALKRKVAVHTAQSRLSGYVIGALPFIVAGGFQVINPGYLTPLYSTNIGRVMVMLAFLFQVAGVLIIRKMASFRV